MHSTTHKAVQTEIDHPFQLNELNTQLLALHPPNLCTVHRKGLILIGQDQANEEVRTPSAQVKSFDELCAENDVAG